MTRSSVGLCDARRLGAPSFWAPVLRVISAAVCVLAASPSTPRQQTATTTDDARVSILVYHRFGLEANDSMTVRTANFRSQLEYLRQHDHPVVPLQSLVQYLRSQGAAPPQRAVVITVDDGHRSVFSDMLPLVLEYRVPVTLFVYPSAISNAPYALTWADLQHLQQTGLVDIQSHTYWHPNFKTERQRLAAADFRAFVTLQMVKPRTVLRDRLAVNADLLAWPFGIYDDDLIQAAGDAGYLAGFTLEPRLVTSRDRSPARIMALPRFLVSDRISLRTFASMLPQ